MAHRLVRRALISMLLAEGREPSEHDRALVALIDFLKAACDVSDFVLTPLNIPEGF